MPLRFAITGAGYIADIHAQALHSLPDVDLVSVIARDSERTHAFIQKFNVPHHFTHLDTALKTCPVDAVIICTPNALHGPETQSALQAGCHVLVEKPFTFNYEEVPALQKTLAQSGCQLMVAHCWRFDEEVLWLKKQVEEQKIGKIIRTKGYGVHSNWGPGGWFTQSALAGGGALADMGIHALDTARFLLGDPQPASVYAKIGAHYGEYDVDDTGIVIVEWDNQATSYIESGWWQPHMDGPEASTQLYGRKGFGEVFPTRIKQCSPKEGQENWASEWIEGGFQFPRENQCPQVMYDRQMAYFIDCIQNQITPNPGFEEGRINMQIVDAAYQSAQTGEVIRF